MSKRNTLVVVILSSILFVAAVGPAAPGVSSPGVTLEQPLTVKATEDGLEGPVPPAATLEAAFSAAGSGAKDPLRAARGLTEAVAGALAHAPGVHVAHPPSPSAGAPATGATGSGYAGLAAADVQGDATGDGRAEVLVLHFPVGGEPEDAEAGGGVHTFRMLAASTGASLWTAEIEADLLSWVPAVDLDGDGLTDVIALSLAAEGDPMTVGDVLLQPFAWHLVAYRGTDGQVLWEEREAWTYAIATGGPLEGSLVSPALFYLAIVGPDADGDGGMDVWLNAIDGASLSASAASTDARAHRFTLRSGADGGVVSAAALGTAAQGSSIAFPVQDVGGDGLADTILSVFTADPVQPSSPFLATLVQAAEGTTGRPLWSNLHPGAFAVGLPFPDLTGDGLADVVTTVLPADRDVRLQGVSGADGSDLWTIEDPLFLGFAAGNVDGVGGTDIVFLDGETTGGALSPRVQAVTGDAGEVLYDTHPFSVTIPTGGYASVEFRPLAGDVDGDGTQDTILNAENGRFPEQFTGDIHAVRSADGQDHLVVPGTSYEGRPGGDLTGDGLDDLLRLEVETSPFTVTTAGIDAADGSVLWSTVVEGSQGYALATGGDLGGSNAEDVLLKITTPGDDGLPDAPPTTLLDARDGPSGGLLWSAP